MPIERASYDLGLGRVTIDMPGRYYDPQSAKVHLCRVVDVTQDGDVTIELDDTATLIHTKWCYVTPRS